MRAALVAVVAVGLLVPAACPATSRAQVTTPTDPWAVPPAEHFAGPWPRERLASEELERLVGPIALYPDPLLAHVLAAAADPVDVVRAARLLRNGGNETTLDAADLHASVKALARNPEVILMMDTYLEWTERLGQAHVEQPGDVMTSIQRLRIAAHGLGHLSTAPQQEVIVEREIVRIVPVTEYVYVPTYAPPVVYHRPCPPAYRTITFRSCSRVGPWHDLDCDWRERTVCRREGWSWRDWCDQRSANRRTVAFRWWRGDDDRCQIPPRRHDPEPCPVGTPRWDSWDRDRRPCDDDDRRRPACDSPRRPRAAEPNPPSIVARPPTPRPPQGEAPRPRGPHPTAREATPGPSPDAAPAKRPQARPEPDAKPRKPVNGPVAKERPDAPGPPSAAPRPMTRTAQNPRAAEPPGDPPRTTKPRGDKPGLDSPPAPRPEPKPAARPAAKPAQPKSVAVGPGVEAKSEPGTPRRPVPAAPKSGSATERPNDQKLARNR